MYKNLLANRYYDHFLPVHTLMIRLECRDCSKYFGPVLTKLRKWRKRQAAPDLSCWRSEAALGKQYIYKIMNKILIFHQNNFFLICFGKYLYYCLFLKLPEKWNLFIKVTKDHNKVVVENKLLVITLMELFGYRAWWKCSV